ncbi:hypothetical protein D560_3300 [Bordetella holmesii ATCC 51541]|nr:hypothetical protein D560_3300 [Bordetella holmesii ATCC 51541]
MTERAGKPANPMPTRGTRARRLSRRNALESMLESLPASATGSGLT